MSAMKLFVLDRLEDETGISGTGIIAEGVQFSNGKCALNWLSEHTSTAIYDDIETLMKIHGHDGKTVIMWEVRPKREGRAFMAERMMKPAQENASEHHTSSA